LLRNGQNLVDLSNDETVRGYKDYIRKTFDLEKEAHAIAASVPGEARESWATAIAGIEKIRIGYFNYITTPSGPERKGAYRDVLKGQQIQAGVANDLKSRGCVAAVESESTG